MSGRRDSNPRPSAWKANALSTELLPQSQWARMDSNHRRHKPADLQSAPFGHSGTCPLHCCNVCFKKKSGRRDSNPRPSAWKANALSTELLPQFRWAKMDSNHRRRKPADLQSAPFGHSGICPTFFRIRLRSFFLSLLSDSNQRPRDYKSRALAN